MTEHMASFPVLTCMLLSPVVGLCILLFLKEKHGFLIRMVSLLSAGVSFDLNGNGIPDECEGVSCPADVNGDGVVNIDDIFEVLAAWGPCE